MHDDILGFAQVMTIIVVSAAALATIFLAARAIWLRTTPKRHAPGLEHDDSRTQRLESAVDAIAIEVERISEAQRYMVNLLGESAAQRRGELMSADRTGRNITPH